MRLTEIFKITKGTKVVLTITFTVSVLAVLFAYFYYRNLNNLEDPRVLKAREYMSLYEKKSASAYSLDAFPLLDSASAVFRSYPDYKSSFETGVIYNNKCSVLLMMALYDSTISNNEKEKLLNLSMMYCDSSISVYRNWISVWENLSPDSVAERIRPQMSADDKAFEGRNFKKIFEKRIRNIAIAQIETPRRLSVSLSNRGTIFRHLLMPDSALGCYRQALSIWKDNRTAKSNLSVLMGGDPVKPTIIESLFPPDKNKR